MSTRPATTGEAIALAALWQRHHGDGGPVSGRSTPVARGDSVHLFARGDMANLYQTGRGLLKLARDPADNDLIEREAAALSRIRHRGDPRFSAYFPRLLDTQRVQDPRTGAERSANLLGALDGFASLMQVRAAFAGGVDPRDVAWMWRRLLVAIGAATEPACGTAPCSPSTC